jgi:hypothetical protein
MKEIYNYDMLNFRNGKLPCQLRLEFMACLERLLCFCHTGNTAAFATSLMNPLGLSRGVLKDGFPTLLPLFEQPTMQLAKMHGFRIRPSAWPRKKGYPAMASKRAQVLTYSMEHFLVSTSIALYGRMWEGVLSPHIHVNSHATEPWVFGQLVAPEILLLSQGRIAQDQDGRAYSVFP